MEQNNREDRITFELMDRITLEENSSDISVIRNVEVKPEIEMVAEYSSYRIRGALVFTGEYEARKQGEGAHPLLLDRSANYNKRVVRQIHHRIPVDISVPADRVDDAGIVMEIVSLDYDLNDPNLLVITTELELQGVYKEEVVKNAYWDQATSYDYVMPVEDERGLDSPPLQKDSMQDATPIQEENDGQSQGQQNDFVEAQPAQVQQDIIAANGVSAENKDDGPERQEEASTAPEVREDVQRPTDTNEQIDTSNPDDRTEVEAPITIVTEDNAYEAEQPRDESVDMEIPIEQGEAQVSPPAEMRDPDVKVTITNKNRDVESKISAPTESMVEMESAEEEVQKEGRTQTASLLSMFLKNKEESMTQIKICLVQPGETLSEIARRYNTNEDDILAINDLTVTSAIGGKVLKIPVRNAR